MPNLQARGDNVLVLLQWIQHRIPISNGPAPWHDHHVNHWGCDTSSAQSNINTGLSNSSTYHLNNISLLSLLSYLNTASLPNTFELKSLLPSIMLAPTSLQAALLTCLAATTLAVPTR